MVPKGRAAALVKPPPTWYCGLRSRGYQHDGLLNPEQSDVVDQVDGHLRQPCPGGLRSAARKEREGEIHRIDRYQRPYEDQLRRRDEGGPGRHSRAAEPG